MTENKVAVEQIDQDAAADLIEAYWQNDQTMRKLAQSYRDGHRQGVWAIAFARHRTRALEASQAERGEYLRQVAIDMHNRAIFEAAKICQETSALLPEYIQKEPKLVGKISSLLDALSVKICEILPDPEKLGLISTPTRIEAVQPQEAVAWMYELFDMKEVHMQRLPGRISWKETPLYATPPQAAESDLPPGFVTLDKFLDDVMREEAAESGLLDEAVEALKPFANVAEQIRAASKDNRWLEQVLFYMGTDDDPSKWSLTGRAFDRARAFVAKAGKPGEAGNGEG